MDPGCSECVRKIQEGFLAEVTGPDRGGTKLEKRAVLDRSASEALAWVPLCTCRPSGGLGPEEK